MKKLPLIPVCIIVVLGISAMGCAGYTSPLPTAPNNTTRSFRNDVKPIFSKYGCASCHGGSGGLQLGTVAQLLEGGIHGPAAIPGKADSSLIIRKISSNPPFGDRMPKGGAKVADADAQVLRDWINEGAIDN